MNEGQAAIQCCIHYYIKARSSFHFSVVTLKMGGAFLMENRENNRYSKTSKLVIISLMVALALILNRIVPATPVYHLSLDFLAIFVVGLMYGPIWGGLAYGLADTIGSILIPFGPYNPGITATLVLVGVVYGLCFYRRELEGKKFILMVIISALIIFAIKLFLTTLALWPMYGAGDTYWAYVIMRLPNCIAILIAQVVTTPIMYKILKNRIHII